MIPKLTDDAIAGLPLDRGRADLLEEIMSTPVLDEPPAAVPDTEPRRSWWVPAAAAAMVAVFALTGAWWAADPAPEQHADTPPAATLAPDGQYVVLDAPGWTLTSTSGSVWSRSVIYDRGDQNLDINWTPAPEYRSLVADRRRINRPPSDGEPLEVLGLPAQMWAYYPDEHTAIREPQGGWAIEIRATGMEESAYRRLLDQLRLVDEAGFEAALPPEYADSGDRDERVADLVAGIQEHVDPLFPDGRQHVITSYAFDPYYLGVDVVSAVACAWFDDLVAARAAGDAGREQRALDALGTAREWPVLQEMTAKGTYPQMLWGTIDLATDGEVPDWYADGLGCAG